MIDGVVTIEQKRETQKMAVDVDWTTTLTMS